MRLILYLSLLLGLCACQKVAFYVNGEGLPVAELERAARLSHSSPDDPELLRQLINAKLMQQAARRHGLVPGPEVVDKQVAAARAQAGGDEQLRARLVAQGMSMRDFRRDTEARLLILAFTDALTGDIEVTEAELKAYYEANLTQLKRAAAWGVEVLVYDSQEAAEQARAAYLAGRPLAELVIGAGQASGPRRLSENDTSPDTQALLSVSRSTAFGEPSPVTQLAGEPPRYAFTVPERYYLGQTPRFEDIRLQLQAQLEQRLGQARLAETLAALQGQAELRAGALELPEALF